MKYAKIFIRILLLLSFLFFSQQTLATTYVFSDAGVIPLLSGCSKTGTGTYTCTSAVTLTGNDSITIAGTTPATITFNSNLTLQFISNALTAKINVAGSTNNLSLIVNGTLTTGKLTVVNANVKATAVNDTGGDVTFGGNIATTTGTINIGYNTTVLGAITSTTGNISLVSDETVQSISCSCNISGGYGIIYNGNVSGVSVTSNSTHSQFKGSITATTGGVTLGQYTTVTGAVSSISGNITLYGNNTVSSTVNCTSCTMNVYNTANRINGAINVNYLDDSSTGSSFQNNITATSTSGKSAFIYIGNSSTVTGNVNAYSSFGNNAQVRIRNGASVTGNVGAYASGSSSLTDAYIYLDSSSTVTGDITANSTGANQTVRVEKYSDATVNGSISATAATASYATVFLYSGTVTGDVISSDDIYTYANIGGCAQTYSPSATNTAITLYFGSSTNATCRGTTSCSSDLRYIDNWTFSPTPPICSLTATKIAEYNLEQSSWTGLTNETKDTAGYTGGPYDGQGVGTTKPTADRSAPALSGTTGTCGYASFSGNALQSAFTLDGLPILTTTGEKTTVSFWMYWDGNTNYSTPIGWNLYALSIGNNVFGFDTFNGDRYGISSSALAIGWRHIVAVFNNGNVTQSQLYIDGVKQTLSQVRGSPNNSNAFVQSTLNIARITRTDVNNLGFNGGRIDEVKVYNGEMTLSQVTADFTATHTCTGMPNLLANYHFEESTWTTAAGQVIDASGNGYHASVAKSSNTLRAQTEDAVVNRFVASNPGTCGYSVFGSDGPIVLPSSMPNLTGSFTFATWYIELSSSATARRIFADDYNESGGGFVFSANDGGTGKLRFAKRSPMAGTTVKILDSSYTMTSGTKYFIAVSVDATNQTASIYVFNTSGTLLNKTTGSMDYFGASNTGNMTIGGAQSSSGNTYLNHARMDEVSIYNSALSQSEILALLQTNHTCIATNVAAANFNCVITGGSADTGRLYTQLSNTGFNIDVVALKSDRTAETSFVTSGTKNVTIEWLSGANNTCTTGTLLTPSATVTFSTTDNGRKTVSIPALNKAYRDLRCRITDANQTPNVVGCSSDNFSVRPYQLVLSTSNAGADAAGISTTSTPAIKAGSSFNLTATAIKSSTVTDVDIGYDGTPTAHSTLNDTVSPKVVAHSGAVTKGLLSGTFGQAAAGVASGNFIYDEVGYFKLNQYAFVDSSFTAVDIAGGDCVNGYSTSADASGKVGCYLYTTNTNYFGRFTPDHFEISNVSSTPQCGSFNYYGQDLPSSFKITAKDHPSLNTTTQNYTGSFAKLGLTNWASGYNFSASTLPTGASLTSGGTAPSGTWSSGVATITASHKIDRLNNPMLPTNISINAAPTDSDNITTTSTAIASNIPFRYGRIYFPNTFGSELLPLVVPIQVQYWTGIAYALNISDSCTNLSNANFGMSNYKGNLSGSPTCETRISSVGSTLLGLNKAILSAPGWGNTGSVDLTLLTNNTTGGLNTCTSLTPSAATARNYPWFGAPAAKRATFGIFKSPIIFMHENF